MKALFFLLVVADFSPIAGRQAAEAHLSQVAREVAREAVLQMQRRAEAKNGGLKIMLEFGVLEN